MRILMIVHHALMVHHPRCLFKHTVYNILNPSHISRYFQQSAQTRGFSDTVILLLSLHRNVLLKPKCQMFLGRDFSSSLKLYKNQELHTDGKEDLENTSGEKQTQNLKLVKVFSQADLFLGQMSLVNAQKMAKDKKEKLTLLAGSAEDGVPSYRLIPLSEEDDNLSKKAGKATKDEKQKREKMFKIKSKIEQHDLQIKMNQMRKALQEGRNIKVVMRFGGRDFTKQNHIAILKTLVESLDDVGKSTKTVAKTLNEINELAETRKSIIEILFSPKKT